MLAIEPVRARCQYRRESEQAPPMSPRKPRINIAMPPVLGAIPSEE